MLWSAEFEDPIALPDGRLLITLDDARTYLVTLPESRHKDRDVEAAIEALMMAANGTGPIMHASIGISRVVHGQPTPPAFTGTAKISNWRKTTKLKRDQ